MFIRRHKSGVSRIKIANYNTNQFGEQERSYWWKLSKQVRARDRDQCFLCKAPATEVHHITPLSRGGSNTLANLACICKPCHDRRHNHLHAERGGKHDTFKEPF